MIITDKSVFQKLCIPQQPQHIRFLNNLFFSLKQKAVKSTSLFFQYCKKTLMHFPVFSFFLNCGCKVQCALGCVVPYFLRVNCAEREKVNLNSSQISFRGIPGPSSACFVHVHLSRLSPLLLQLLLSIEPIYSPSAGASCKCYPDAFSYSYSVEIFTSLSKSLNSPGLWNTYLQCPVAFQNLDAIVAANYQRCQLSCSASAKVLAPPCRMGEMQGGDRMNT